MSIYASGKHSKAVCDICGFTYPYNTLKENSYGLWVCPTDWEGGYDLVNHPQNQAPDIGYDAQALEHPRPDVNVEVSSSWSVSSTTYVR